MTTNTNTVAESDVLAAVAKFVEDNKRPCPTKHLTAEFGDGVLDTLESLKADGVLLGLRGRNGGFALPGSEIVAKRAEYAAKKAAAAPAVEEDVESAVG